MEETVQALDLTFVESELTLVFNYFR